MPVPAACLEFPALHDRRYPVHRVAERLEPYLRVIVERFHPAKIILFGSFAYGQPDRNSDFDLLVLRSHFASEKQSNIEIRRSFWEVPGPRPSFTVITKTPEQVARRISEGSPFYTDIMGQGFEVYAA